MRYSYEFPLKDLASRAHNTWDEILENSSDVVYDSIIREDHAHQQGHREAH